MPALPTVGGSSGTWGTELNTWLLTAHNADGTIKELSINAKTASYTLILSDAGKVIEVNSASPTALSVPANSSVAFPIGTLIEICQMGAGQVTVQGAVGGVVIRSAGGKLKLVGQYSSCSLRKRATDEWVLVGDLMV